MKRCMFCNGCDIDPGGWCHGCERFNERLAPGRADPVAVDYSGLGILAVLPPPGVHDVTYVRAWKPSDGYDPAAQRDARPKKYPAPTPLCLLKLWERRLTHVDSLAYVRATLHELRQEIERRER